jgi:hypothetical protein
LETAGLLNEAELIYNKNGLITVKNAEELKQQALETSKIADINTVMTQAGLKEAQKNLSIETASSNIFKDGLISAFRSVGFGNYAVLARDENREKATTDFEYSNSDLIEEYAQKLVDNGLAGVQLSEKIANDLASKYPDELSFLAKIADRQDILNSISEVAKAIQGSEIGGKAYRVEAARRAADFAGFEAPDLPESQLDDFYDNLYSQLLSGILKEKGLASINDLNIGKNSTDRAAAYQAFADQSGGQYSYDASQDTLVDNATSKNVTDVNETLIKLAYFTSLMTSGFSELYASSVKLKDTENA